MKPLGEGVLNLRTMGLTVAIGAAMLITAAPASARMNAAIFLAKADSLRARGPLALFSSDLKKLQAEAEGAGDELHNEHAAELAAGRPTPWCAPVGKYLAPRELLVGMHALPRAELERMDIKQAMYAVFERNYPCHGQAVAKR